MAEIPNIVPPGWVQSIEVTPVILRFYDDGRILLEHECHRTRGGRVIIHAPALQLRPGGHVIDALDPITISPSIGCDDCGLHGFIRAGQWVAA